METHTPPSSLQERGHDRRNCGFPVIVHDEGELCSVGSQKFSRQEIGEKVYVKVMVTLGPRTASDCRIGDSCTCLSGAYSKWSGVEITDKGQGMAIG